MILKIIVFLIALQDVHSPTTLISHLHWDLDS